MTVILGTHFNSHHGLLHLLASFWKEIASYLFSCRLLRQDGLVAIRLERAVLLVVRSCCSYVIQSKFYVFLSHLLSGVGCGIRLYRFLIVALSPVSCRYWFSNNIVFFFIFFYLQKCVQKETWLVFESTAYLKFAKLQYVSSGFRCRVIGGSLMRLY